MEIIPAIMPKSFSDLSEKTEKVFLYVDYIQIDIMDGKFVEAKSWPFFEKDKQSARELMEGEIKLPFGDKIKYEFDLMVQNPENDLKKYQRLGASRLVIHANSIENMDDFLGEIERFDLEWGVAFLVTDELSDWINIINKADFIQLMGIENIGYQGQIFDPRVLDQIKKIKQLKPDVIISVDGGVNLEIARELGLAGVSRLVSGSTIFGANSPEVSINDLKRISNV